MTQSKYEMISVEDALAIVLDHIHVGPPARVPLGDALGLVLAEDCAAREPMPPFAAASVDGFAIRTADGAAPRRYIGEQMAGSVAGIRVEPGTALRITTGAPVPDGADAIVMVEVAAERDGMVVVQEVPKRGDGIRPVGQDIAAGDVVVRGGTLLGPAEIGLLATIGRAEVPVIPRPRAAVMSTGDELVEPSQAPGPGQIRDSNRYALLAAARAAGAETVSLGVARDNAAELGAKIDDALTRSDLIVSSGGVSMGQLDLVKPLLERRGRVHFGRVTMKPGKPLTFVTIGETPFFALPGFPVSSLVSFELFVRPALLKMAGRVDIMRPRITVALAHDVSHDAARTEFQRAVAHLHGSEYQAATTGFQGSGRLLSMAGANVLIKLPVGRGDFKRGELVEALVIGEIR